MANLEESQDVDLDAILGELCALETQCDQEIAGVRNSKRTSMPVANGSAMSHSRCSSEGQRMKLEPGEDHGGKHDGGEFKKKNLIFLITFLICSILPQFLQCEYKKNNLFFCFAVGRTESPDNDSAFSDNVSMLSSESSASSGGSSGASKTSSGLGIDSHPQVCIGS